MKNQKSFWIGLVIIGLFHVNTALAEDTTLNVSAIIQIAASISNTVDIDFGTIIADPSGDTITIDASALANTAATPAVAGATGTSVITNSNSGRIDIITAVSSVDISLVFPSGDSTTLDDGSGNTMTVASIDANSSADFTSGTANTYYVHIGGVLTVSPGQTAGTYTGTIDITVNYN